MVVLAKELYFIMNETDEAYLCLDYEPMITYFGLIGVRKYDLFPYQDGAAVVANIQPSFQKVIPRSGFEGYCVRCEEITVYEDVIKRMEREWCRFVMPLEWGTYFFPMNAATRAENMGGK